MSVFLERQSLGAGVGEERVDGVGAVAVLLNEQPYSEHEHAQSADERTTFTAHTRQKSGEHVGVIAQTR